jgi:hypothetical protein
MLAPSLRYKPNQVQSAPLPIREVKADVSLQQGLGEIGQAVADQADQWEREMEATRAREAAIKFDADAEAIMADFLTKKSGNAVDAVAPTEDALAQAKMRLLEGARTGRERELISQTLDARHSVQSRQITRYGTEQSAVYRAQVKVAEVDSNARRAVAAAGDDETQGPLVQSVRLGTYLFATEELGVPPEQATWLADQAVSKVHSDAIARMAGMQDYSGAQRYLTAKFNEIDPDVRADMTKNLAQFSRQADAQNAADLLVAKYAADPAYDVQKELRQIKDPLLRDEIERRFYRLATIHDNKAKDDKATTAQALLGKIYDNKPLTAAEVVWLNGNGYGDDRLKAEREAVEGSRVTKGSDIAYKLSLLTDAELVAMGRRGIEQQVRQAGGIHPEDLAALFKRADGGTDAWQRGLIDTTNRTTQQALALIKSYRGGKGDSAELNGAVQVWVAREVEIVAANQKGQPLTGEQMRDIALRAASRDGKEPFATSKAGQVYQENPAVYGRLSQLFPGRQRSQATAFVERANAGKPGLPWARIPADEQANIKARYPHLTNDELAMAWTDLIMGKVPIVRRPKTPRPK